MKSAEEAFNEAVASMAEVIIKKRKLRRADGSVMCKTCYRGQAIMPHLDCESCYEDWKRSKR